MKTKLYCVYTHSVQNKLVYVGHGTLKRPFYFHNRSLCWNKAIWPHHFEIQVSILKIFDSKKVAAAYEKKLIRMLNPPGNGPNTGV